MAELVTRQDLNLALENLNPALEDLKLGLTVRLGAMLFLAVGALAAIQKLA